MGIFHRAFCGQVGSIKFCTASRGWLRYTSTNHGSSGLYGNCCISCYRCNMTYTLLCGLLYWFEIWSTTAIQSLNFHTKHKIDKGILHLLPWIMKNFVDVYHCSLLKPGRLTEAMPALNHLLAGLVFVNLCVYLLLCCQELMNRYARRSVRLAHPSCTLKMHLIWNLSYSC